VGAEVDDNELDLWIQEMGLDPWSRGIEWTTPPDQQSLGTFSVVVIGAGMAGLNVAVHLARAGVRLTALEKNSRVGETWHENRYPRNACRHPEPSLRPGLRGPISEVGSVLRSCRE